jgi:hypothetical protein
MESGHKRKVISVVKFSAKSLRHDDGWNMRDNSRSYDLTHGLHLVWRVSFGDACHEH